MTKTMRSSNIELLRIITIMGVVILHYNGNVAFQLVEQGSFNHNLLLFLEGIFVCAVNLFVLITGYFSSKTFERRAIKILELIVQVMAIGLLKFFVSCFAFGTPFSVRGMIGALIPNNYFVFIYIGLYVVSPYINLAIEKLNQIQFKRLLIVNLIIFSLLPNLMDVIWEITDMHFSGMYMISASGSGLGYTLIQFVLMYLLGAYIQKFGVPEKLKSVSMLLCVAVSVGVLFVWQLVLSQSAREYCNPFVILIAVLVFMLFTRINIKSRFINNVSKASFTTFLLHDLFLPYIGIEKVVNHHSLLLLVHVIVSVLVIYFACWVVWFLYDLITKPVFVYINKYICKMDELISVSFEERR